MSQALRKLRNSPKDKHSQLLLEIQEFIQAEPNDLQEFLQECLKIGLFDLLKYIYIIL